MKRRINLIDALFDNEGHYVADVLKYKYLLIDYEIHYFINGFLDNKNKVLLEGFVVHEAMKVNSFFGEVRYLINIFRQVDKTAFNFIMSCKYAALFVSSVYYSFYSYFVLIHFFPTRNKMFHKSSLNYILNKCNGFVVLDEYVKNDVLRNLDRAHSYKVFVVHSRDIVHSTVSKKNSGKIKVSFIGSMNHYKDISSLLELISHNFYDNIEFGFYSKGIYPLLQKLNSFNRVVVRDEYFSDVEFNQYLRNSDYLYLSYTQDYGIRFSGMLFDALNNGCQLICNHNPSFNFYINKYNCGYVFRDQQELDSILRNLQRLEINNEIYDHYCYEVREKLFLNILDNFFNRLN